MEDRHARYLVSHLGLLIVELPRDAWRVAKVFDWRGQAIKAGEAD